MGDHPTPFRDAAGPYRQAGWMGTLPLPFRHKQLTKTGWTGHKGQWPSGADVQAWIDSDRADEGRGNIALRLPPGVVGLDVDDYGDKHGGDDLAALEAKWGKLPATWHSTSRDDGVSGIGFYRVEEGLWWPGQAGPSIEVIQHTHRYAVVWPSVHPEGRTYRWYRPDGMATLAIPHLDELPWLPDTWVVGLTEGRAAEEVRFADMGDSEVSRWILLHGVGEPCAYMSALRDKLLSEMHSSSAHGSLRLLMGLVRFAEQGHPGLFIVLEQVRQRFVEVAMSHGRSEPVVRSEWQRSLDGSVRRVLGAPTVGERTPGDPCNDPLDRFAGLLAASDLARERERHAAAAASVAPVGSVTVTTSAVPDLLALPGSERDDWYLLDAPVGPAVPGIAPPVAGPAGHGVIRERTSWWERDLRAVAEGAGPPPPVYLRRSDGQALFYAGRVNGILGESESGKSWLAQKAASQAMMEDGSYVLYLDFEDSPDGVVSRFKALGVPVETIVEQLVYIDPSEGLHVFAQEDLAEIVAKREYALVIVDGVNALMTLLGKNPDSTPDVTYLYQTVLRRLAHGGRAVVTIDHLPKSKENQGKGGIGSQAKRSMMDGCCIKVDVVAEFGRGLTGKLKLTVDKDRAGHVRGASDSGKSIGLATLTSHKDTGVVSVEIEAQAGKKAPSLMAERRDNNPFRPTQAMAAISRLLEKMEGGLTGRQLMEEINYRDQIVRAGIERLVEEGFVSQEPGARRAIIHRSLRPFTEIERPGDDR